MPWLWESKLRELSDWLTLVMSLSRKLSWIREKGNVVGQAQVIPKHVTRAAGFSSFLN